MSLHGVGFLQLLLTKVGGGVVSSSGLFLETLSGRRTDSEWVGKYMQEVGMGLLTAAEAVHRGYTSFGTAYAWFWIAAVPVTEFVEWSAGTLFEKRVEARRWMGRVRKVLNVATKVMSLVYSLSLVVSWAGLSPWYFTAGATGIAFLAAYNLAKELFFSKQNFSCSTCGGY